MFKLQACIFIFIHIICIWGQNNNNMLDISKKKGFWLDANTIFWDLSKEMQQENITYALYYDAVGKINIDNISDFPSYRLSLLENKTVASFKYPHLTTCTRFSISISNSEIDKLIKGQLVLAAHNENEIIATTGLQIWGVLDELYTTNETLGISYENNIPTLRIWAPTAINVKLHLWQDSNEKVIYNLQNSNNGVWEICGDISWNNKFYLYEIEVFVPETGKIEKNIVTDPYSLSLSTNSYQSQIVDLHDSDLKPQNWDSLQKPSLDSFNDISIYELHLRDFSIYDSTVPQEQRGTFMAFSASESNGMKHLQGLAKHGLTHLHFLPLFDIATINEDKQQQKVVEIPECAANSEVPQQKITAIKDEDGFNWGYDPFHYNVPEGSYAVVPQGSHRILEMRTMVQCLNKIGLRVIMDVVYNHTHSAGQDHRSVLDRIVPGYYYRLDRNGYRQNSSCCPDTASERIMMQKLMIDSLVIWAKYYKIDGFRFDLMGHHTTDNLAQIRKTLDKLTLEKDGVDGGKIYLYGEGWTFGSLHAILPEKNMNQQNSRGMGIGTFNDRMRDCVRGGNFEHRTKSDQGFINGLYYDYNECSENAEITPDKTKQLERLFNISNNIRISLTGALHDFSIVDEFGKNVYGYEIDYRGAPSGYTDSPQECINYISAHDNYTLWDQISAKAPFHRKQTKPATTTIEERVQMQNLGLSLVMLAQGIPFVHAGCDMLRSKSGDGDSYNSGDWFNKLDFSYHENNWGVGLPIKEKNYYEWDFWRPRLIDTNLKPKQQHILECVAHFRRLLSIRYSSKLFRLPNATEIKKRVKFINAAKGSEQTPGLIVMAIDNSDLAFDQENKKIFILWNANNKEVTFEDDTLKHANLILHPQLLKDVIVEVEGKEKVVTSKLNNTIFFNSQQGTIVIPSRTTLVFQRK